MEGNEHNNPLVVLFIDSLGSDELQGTLEESCQAKIEAPVLNVTPCVVSPILTGKTAEHHNLIRPTKIYEDDIKRPACETLMEKYPEDRVLSYKIPFSANLDVEKGAVFPSAPRMNVRVTNPMLHIPRGQFSLVKAEKGEEDYDNIFNSIIDYIWEFFAHFRQLIRNDTADIYFLSIRDVDSLTHFNKPKMRKAVIGEIEKGVRSFMEEMNCPILYFSDHGATSKTDVFRINKWAQEKGYLDVDIHLERWKRQTKGDREVDQQISVHTPFVQIQKGSKVISADAFDATLDTLGDCDEETVQEIMDELESLPYFTRVYHKREIYDKGPHYEEIPTIIPQRKEGVLVTGNLHPKVGVTEEDTDNQGSIRTGVHKRNVAVIGSNIDLGLDKEMYKPTEVYGIIKDFIDSYKPETEEKEEKGREVKDRLQRLGYL